MPHSELIHHFERIDDLVAEMNAFVPNGAAGAADFRADLAGMLVVAIVAMYESCAKDTMVGFAGKQHAKFESFATNQFDRLSSRIRVGDLKKYCSLFDPTVRMKFDNIYKRRRATVLRLSGLRLEEEFDKLLGWRHDFAHAGTRNTTIEEAVRTHRVAKVIMLSFYDAFN